MRLAFANVFLRLGCTLVAFMVLFGHLLWISILPKIDCATDGHALWFALFWMSIPTLIFTALLLASKPLTAVTSGLKWLCIPVILLLPLALLGVWPTLQDTTFGGAPICEHPANFNSSMTWQVWWAPLQFVVLTAICIQTVRYWRMAAESTDTP